MLQRTVTKDLSFQNTRKLTLTAVIKNTISTKYDMRSK